MSSWTDKRPMSPHLQVWRWHLTLATSILHRFAGIGNYIGMFIVVAWLFATATDQETYDLFAGIVGTIWVQILLFGFTVSVCFHWLTGLRHLFWDVGVGFNPKQASFVSGVMLLLAVVAAVAVWVLAGLVPGFDPLGAGAAS